MDAIAAGAARQLGLDEQRIGQHDQRQRRIEERPPTDVTGSKVARLNDACGNLIQIIQLQHW
jgi:hypothetical protein